MKFKVKMATEITVEFDETSKQFKELFENYNQYVMQCNCWEFAETVASLVARYGIYDQIEGVGYPKNNGEPQTDYTANPVCKIDNPINVEAEFDLNGKVCFDIDYTVQL
jgi:hypothetical protein